MTDNNIEQVNMANELEARRAKVKTIRERDGVVWKDKFERTGTIEQIRKLGDGETVSVPGRITALRWLGKLMFGRIYDIDGEIQFSFSRDAIGEETYKFLKANADRGDFIGITGELYHTDAGELTIRGTGYTILAKALRPLPEKFHGLQDTEARYRQRYLDIISNPETRDTMKFRFKMLRFIREFLYKNDFTEVETPIMQNIASGAAAKPFITHHNALDADFYLRIAPEIYLKETIAAGFDRVFELGKNFRNEGMDAQHLQEFTMLEWYASYWDFNNNIEFSTKLIQEMLLELKGTLKIPYQGKELDFGTFARVDYIAAMSEKIGKNILDFNDTNEFKKYIADHGLFSMGEMNEIKSVPSLIDFLFKNLLRKQTFQPTFFYNYPSNLKPLARVNDNDERAADVFQLVVAGAEMINAYSELVDPIAQREKLEDQAKNKDAGDDEAFETDEEFLRAMEHGMPPISGLGMGIDRWVMMLCDQPTVRDIILYPIMK
jgi:lysyl-tRNA synthetase class 2